MSEISQQTIRDASQQITNLHSGVAKVSGVPTQNRRGEDFSSFLASNASFLSKICPIWHDKNLQLLLRLLKRRFFSLKVLENRDLRCFCTGDLFLRFGVQNVLHRRWARSKICPPTCRRRRRTSTDTQFPQTFLERCLSPWKKTQFPLFVSFFTPIVSFSRTRNSRTNNERRF